jgi:hypothetical protein
MVMFHLRPDVTVDALKILLKGVGQGRPSGFRVEATREGTIFDLIQEGSIPPTGEEFVILFSPVLRVSILRISLSNKSSTKVRLSGIHLTGNRAPFEAQKHLQYENSVLARQSSETNALMPILERFQRAIRLLMDLFGSRYGLSFLPFALG